jgi:RimJ/RimL family protein N-acetyltransferase
VERIAGSRIVLREYALTDSVDIHRWRSDPQTTVWMGPKFRQPIAIEEQRIRLERIIGHPTEDAVYCAIADKGTSRYLGGIDLTGIDWIDKRAVLSIVIGEEADRGKGYGSEAIQLLLRHAFGKMQLHRIELNVSARNGRAVACYQRNGFQIEGRKREHTFVNGEYSDDIQMAILENEHRTAK